MNMPTGSNWPRIVDDFINFLTDAGLQFQTRNQEAAFGDKMLQYGGQRVNVRIVSDRGVWYVELADASHQANEWYDAAILRDLIRGPGEDVLSLEKQIDVIEKNWPAIIELFTPGQEEHTHWRLSILREQRAKRRFPNLR